MSSLDRLYFIKTLQTTSGKIEVHIAVNQDNYGTIDHFVTPLSPSDAPNGRLIVDTDVYYLKAAIPPPGTIQLNRLAYNNYSQFDIRAAATPFSPSDAANGFFTIDDESIYFIKMRNTASGFVEVFIARKFDDNTWPKVHLHLETAFKVDEVLDGYLTIHAGDLYYIKTRNTKSGVVELHRADFRYAYTDIKIYNTMFTTSDDRNGIWEVNNDGSLYFIMTKNTRSGRVEVHINMFAGTRRSKEYHFATAFDVADAGNGIWSIHG